MNKISDPVQITAIYCRHELQFFSEKLLLKVFMPLYSDEKIILTLSEHMKKFPQDTHYTVSIY